MRGKPELIDFTTKDGKIIKRWMVPILDEHGGWTHWVLPTAAELEEIQ